MMNIFKASDFEITRSYIQVFNNCDKILASILEN